MSRFYLTAVNSRGNPVTAAGAASGQDCHLRGWNSGVEVVAKPDVGGAEDVFHIFITGGSHELAARKHIGQVRILDGDVTFVPHIGPSQVLA